MRKKRKFFKFRLRHNNRWHIPLPTGPFTVGCTDIMTGSSKFGVFVRLFYPAAENDILTKQRAFDCIKVLDFLEELNNGYPIQNVINPSFQTSQFMGIMDLSKAAVAGHSFGGTTAILSLALEHRFKIGLALDTWMFPLENNQEIFSKVTQPILFVNMEKFQTIRNLRVMKNLESKSLDRKVVTVK
ncbi:platelet-activating factor acetylhydrolase-like [Limulus polyphemus]|uniref:1-alkyl-2-acetylglycerophosphocholine esterase n=1 Tax=Limulus polyphemus TaxID=6850 RepID=A0ABM1TFY5_LIMPO|nr:platelet-activating factor acetylhydrolase-like [Limulus polyphemus]